jgi:protein kinase/serine/threonine-protein kinase
MHGIRKLIRHVHRRSLWQVAAIYMGGAWVALEVVSLLADTAGLPVWLPPFALALLVLGFPVVLATAFVGSGGWYEAEGGPHPTPHEPGGGLPESGTSHEAAEGSPGSGGALGPSSNSAHPPVHGPAAQPLGATTAASATTGRSHVVVRRAYARRTLTWGALAAVAAWAIVVGMPSLAPGSDETVQAARSAAYDDTAPSAVSAAPPSVAVLPFVNRSPDPEHAYFVDGVHENVLVALSGIASLDVTALRSVNRYRDTDQSLADIAAELGVATILEGSVQRAENRIRIITQLMDAASGETLWTETYDRSLDDIFAVQSDVARRVAGAMQATLTPGDLQRLESPSTPSVSTYDLYLRGREAYHRISASDNEEAMRLFRLALDEDPEFAPAWAGLGDAFLQGVQYYGAPRAWADSGRVLATRAIELDPSLAAAHKTLGFAHSMDRHHREALAANLRAVELDPSFADAVNNVGFSYYYLGDMPKALQWVKRALRLMPNIVLVRSNVGVIRLVGGDAAGAREWLEHAHSLDPANPGPRNWLTMLEVYRGDPAAGLALAESFLQGRPEGALAYGRVALAALLADRPELALANATEAMAMAPGTSLLELYEIENVRGTALSVLGRSDDALPLLEPVLARSDARLRAGADGWQDPWAGAAAAAALGRDDALDRLDHAVQSGFPFYPLLERSPGFDSVRDEPRFQELLRVVRERSRQHRAEIEAAELAERQGGPSVN